MDGYHGTWLPKYSSVPSYPALVADSYLIFYGDFSQPMKEKKQGRMDIMEPRCQSTRLYSHILLQWQNYFCHPSGK